MITKFFAWMAASSGLATIILWHSSLSNNWMLISLVVMLVGVGFTAFSILPVNFNISGEVYKKKVTVETLRFNLKASFYIGAIMLFGALFSLHLSHKLNIMQAMESWLVLYAFLSIGSASSCFWSMRDIRKDLNKLENT